MPWSKSNAAWALFLGTAAPGFFQWKRPVTMRWTTRKRSSSIAHTTRFPSRRKPSTRRPSAVDRGGSHVRSREGLRTRIFRRTRPVRRRSRAST